MAREPEPPGWTSAVCGESVREAEHTAALARQAAKTGNLQARIIELEKGPQPLVEHHRRWALVQVRLAEVLERLAR